jgi:hypothetical protein
VLYLCLSLASKSGFTVFGDHPNCQINWDIPVWQLAIILALFAPKTISFYKPIL